MSRSWTDGGLVVQLPFGTSLVCDSVNRWCGVSDASFEVGVVFAGFWLFKVNNLIQVCPHVRRQVEGRGCTPAPVSLFGGQRYGVSTRAGDTH